MALALLFSLVAIVTPTLPVTVSARADAWSPTWHPAGLRQAPVLDRAVLRVDQDPWRYTYLPILRRAPVAGFDCPTVSTTFYAAGTAFQYEFDDPVRRAYDHADKNIELRSYSVNGDPNLRLELVDYGSGDPAPPPQLATLFYPHRVPAFDTGYRVNNWVWAPSPEPGTRGDPITDWPVTALGMQTTPGEALYVPTSGYDIGGGMEVIVLYADENSVAIKYAREDSAGAPGYTVHIDGLCTDPNLLALYDTLEANGQRYVYVPPGNRPYAYDLPNLPAGQPLGTAPATEIVVAIVDTGAFMDTRSCNEWWNVRPGYPGICPPAQ
jgi:hypothetical protein